MNYLKRWFGWGEQPEASSLEAEDEAHHQQRRERARRQAAGPQQPPLLQEAPEGTGGIQGLDWFQRSMLKDSDGDCAHRFLEEPCRQRERRTQQQGQQREQKGGSRQEDGSAAKQQKAAVLQCCSRRAQLAGPSHMLLDRGNVYVVPEEDAQH